MDRTSSIGVTCSNVSGKSWLMHMLALICKIPHKEKRALGKGPAVRTSRRRARRGGGRGKGGGERIKLRLQRGNMAVLSESLTKT